MALPTVKTLADCIDIDKTVLPFIDQFYALPGQFLQTFTDFQGLKELYISTNPLVTAFTLSLALAPIFLVVSEINRNYSQVDRCWSLLPTVYNAHYALWAHLAGIPSGRLDLVLAASTVWSVSLGV
jgi:steroid 5-alpha reductase family enzyme